MDGSRPLLYLTLFYTLFRAFRAVTARRSEVPLFQPFLKGLSTFVSPPKGFHSLDSVRYVVALSCSCPLLHFPLPLPCPLLLLFTNAPFFIPPG